MNKIKKIFLLTARGVGILLVAFLIFILVSPMLINLETAKERILIHFSEQTGGELHYEKVDLFYFPRPHAVIYQVSLSIPGNVTGTLANLKVYPAIFSLFTGDVQISKLQLITPNFNIKLPIRQKERKIAISPSFAREMLTSVLAYPALNKSSFLVEVKDGRLNLYGENDVSFKFININANTRRLLNRLTVNLACKSNLWKNISIKGLINPHLFTSKGRVDLTLFNPKILTDYLFPETVLKISDAGINLNLDFKSDKHHALHVKVQSHTSYLTLLKENENIVIKVKSLICKLNMDEEKTKVSLSNLALDYPKLRASGQFLLDRMVKQTSLDIDVKKADVVSTRKAAIALAGNSGITKDIFDIVKGGSIPEITFKSFGKSPADLGKIENIFIRGRLRDGNIFVPAALLDLEDVDGSVTVSNGILVGENIKARLGNSFGTKGMLELGFEKNIPFYVETVIQADLAQLPPILNRLVNNKPFLKELSQINKVSGSALGKMVLDGNTQSVEVGVYASKINLSARYERIPYPLQIKGKHFAYRGTQISFDKLNAVIGKSSFSELSGGITWKDEPHLKIKSSLSRFQMEEIYPWLLSFKDFGSALKNIETINGLVTLSSLNFNGPVSTPERWHIGITGEFENIVIDSPFFSYPIFLDTGKFNVTDSNTLDTVKKNFFVESTIFIWGKSHFGLEGNIIFSKGKPLLDMELTADSIDTKKVEQIISCIMRDKNPWPLPVNGVFKIKSKIFTNEDLKFNPVHADIFLKDNNVFIDFTKANLCGISVPGYIKITDDHIEGYFYPLAENQKFAPALSCLFKKDHIATGQFNLTGKLSSVSKDEDWAKALNGNLKFTAESGRIYRFGLLAKILAMINITEIFRGKVPDLVKEGFAYNSIKAEGHFKNGKFIINEWVIDGSSMTIVCEGYIDPVREKIDMVVLVAPFKTVDFIIKHIPLINEVFGGKLVSVPFKVTGDPADPDVVPLHPEDVGAGIFGLLKRTFMLPVTIIQPLLSDKKYKDSEFVIEQIEP
jgi:hypothetical protein